MVNSKKSALTGGVVIDGLNIRKDLFYYKIPPFLSDKVRIGSKVVVPFGPKNIKVSAFLFTLEKNSLKKDLKEIYSIISPPLFDEQIRDLILFTAEKFFIPLHVFVNKTLKGLSPEIYKRFVVCLSCENLSVALKTFSGKKKEISEFIIKRKIVPVSVLKKRFGSYYVRIVKALEEEGFLERVSISEKFSLPYLSLNVPYGESDKILDLFEDKKMRSSALVLIARLVNAQSPLREDVLKRGVRYGKKIIRFLVERKILKEETVRNHNTGDISDEAKFFSVCGSPLFERTEKIVSLIKKRSCKKVLVVFPELSVLKRVSGMYKKEFGEKVFIWDGKSKRKLIEAIYFKEKSIFLATPFALFVKIPGLRTIILEEASSRYFKKTDFTPFDVIVTSIKKAKLERLHLIFSTPVPDENIFYLAKEGILSDMSCNVSGNKTNIKIVDMREEFKRRNYKMISLALQKKMQTVLKNSGNIALLLNRKSYSTFVMCRECGFVMRCPKCGVPLYYDKEEKLLFCHICGYKEKPPDVCPRCGSVSIKYFSGGIQKLEEQLYKMFPSSTIVKLTSENRSDSIVNSGEFRKTIFIGTEYLISHLDLSNVLAFGFVSADIFLNRFSFNASSDTFAIISKISIEMKKKPVYVQTYIPEHFVLSYVTSLKFDDFFRKELELRKELGYPPFGNLIIFTFFSRNKEQTEKSAAAFKEKVISVLADKGKIYGPSPAAIQKRGDYYFFEVTVKSEFIDSSLRETYINSLETFGEVETSVDTYISVKEGFD